MSEGIEARMEAAIAAANRRVATCHQRVACPKCGAPAGARCRRVNRITPRSAGPLKHSHAERLRADGTWLR